MAQQWLTDDVLTWINETHGYAYVAETALAGGFQSGATLIRDPDRGPAVLKWTSDVSWAPVVAAAAPLIESLRAQGWPTPKWLLSGCTPQGWPYQIQEWLPATPADDITHPWLDEVLPLIQTHAGAAPPGGRAWSSIDRAVVFDAAEGHLPAVTRSSVDGEKFVALATAVTRDFAWVVLPEADLVHGDFSEGNILFVDGRICAVVDVEAVGYGSRLHDLATLTVQSLLWGETTCTARILNTARALATPGQVEVTLVAVMAGTLAFGVRNWVASDAAAAARACSGLLRDFLPSTAAL